MKKKQLKEIEIDKEEYIGIIKRIESLGRILIPKDIREYLGLDKEDVLEIFATKNKNIVMRKYFDQKIEDKSNSQGYVRKIDSLGRVAIPTVIKKAFELSEDQLVELFITNSKKIILKKH